MSERLSDDALAALRDAGHASLSWKVPRPSGFLAGIDFSQILAHEDAAAIIEAMPVQPLLYAVKQKGLADCLEVLPLLTQEQFTRILDYEGWAHDQIVPRKVYEWLRAYAQVGPEELARRFADLEEEYQLALLAGRFKVYAEEEFENLSQAEQDRLYPMPCRTVFYDILSEDPEEIEFLHMLVEAMNEHHLSYAYTMLNYFAHVPPQEDEERVGQFRRARLEEDGFVPWMEAVKIFYPTDVEPIRKRWARESVATQALVADDEAVFFDRVLEAARAAEWDIDEQFRVHQGILTVANGLCAASQVEPDDVAGLHRILEQVRGIVGVGLDDLAGGDVERGLEILRGEHAKSLFLVGLARIHGLRREMAERFKAVFGELGDKMLDLVRGQRHGALLLLLDRLWRERLGLEKTETLKGLFNRYPMRPETSESAERVSFTPIRSMRELRLFADQLNGLSAWFHLVQQADAAAKDDAEKGIMTAMVRALLGHEFTARSLALGELDAFTALSDEALSAAIGKVFENLVHTLSRDADVWGLKSVESDIRRGIELALVSMKEQAMGLIMARKAVASDISPLVYTAEGREVGDVH